MLTSILGICIFLTQVLVGHRKFEGHDNFQNGSQVLVALAYFGPTLEFNLFQHLKPLIHHQSRFETLKELEKIESRFKGTLPNNLISPFLESLRKVHKVAD